jgi:hypothetical protein
MQLLGNFTSTHDCGCALSDQRDLLADVWGITCNGLSFYSHCLHERLAMRPIHDPVLMMCGISYSCGNGMALHLTAVLFGLSTRPDNSENNRQVGSSQVVR